MMGFLRRQTSELNDKDVLKSLFCSIVRSNLEYASQVWSNTSMHKKNNIESIQRRMTKLIMPTMTSYESRCENLNLLTLEKRRKLFSIMLFFDVMERHVDCPEILAKLNIFCTPRQLRSTMTFRQNLHRTNYGQAEPVNLMMTNFNEISQLYEPVVSRNSFKNIIIQYLESN